MGFSEYIDLLVDPIFEQFKKDFGEDAIPLNDEDKALVAGIAEFACKQAKGSYHVILVIGLLEVLVKHYMAFVAEKVKKDPERLVKEIEKYVMNVEENADGWIAEMKERIKDDSDS